MRDAAHPNGAQGIASVRCSPVQRTNTCELHDHRRGHSGQRGQQEAGSRTAAAGLPGCPQTLPKVPGHGSPSALAQRSRINTQGIMTTRLWRRSGAAQGSPRASERSRGGRPAAAGRGLGDDRRRRRRRPSAATFDRDPRAGAAAGAPLLAGRG